MSQKVCQDCQQSLNTSSFTVDNKNKDNLSSRCRRCKNIAASIWRSANRGKVNKSNKQYYLRNLGKIRRQNRLRMREKIRDPEYKQRRREQRKRRWLLDPQAHFVAYRSNAKRRKISFALSFEDFNNFWKKPCTYCGESIETVCIDRIDSSLGYVAENITPCCFQCNSAKLDLTRQQFINWIQRVHNFLLGNKDEMSML
jgi:hypothetical protein